MATSDVILDVARLVKAELISTRVGEPHIVVKMKEEKAQIGGEENGGVIYQGWSWTREGMLTALTILELMAQEDQSLEEIDRQFPSYAQVKDGIPCSNDQKIPLLEKVATLVPSDAESEIVDGVKLRYPDGWILLRPSGTEPTFRVFTEAKTKKRAKSLVQMGLKLIKEALAEISAKTNKKR